MVEKNEVSSDPENFELNRGPLSINGELVMVSPNQGSPASQRAACDCDKSKRQSASGGRAGNNNPIDLAGFQNNHQHDQQSHDGHGAIQWILKRRLCGEAVLFADWLPPPQ